MECLPNTVGDIESIVEPQLAAHPSQGRRDKCDLVLVLLRSCGCPCYSCYLMLLLLLFMLSFFLRVPFVLVVLVVLIVLVLDRKKRTW